MKKDILIAIVSTIVVIAIVVYNFDRTNAASNSESISQMEQDIAENESRYAEIESQLDVLNNSKEDLAAYIKNLNDSYSLILNTIEELDKQIEENNAKIEKVNSEIQEKEREIDDQYAQMALRIQYMYENNSMNIFNAVMSADTFSDIINEMSYFQDIFSSDRNALAGIEEELVKCNAMKEELEKDKKKLDKLKAEQEKERKNMEQMMADASVNISSKQSQIEEAEAVAAKMVEEMDAKRNSIEKLKEEESRRIEEESRKAAMAERGEVEETVAYEQIDGDLKRLAAIIYCEAQGEPYEGQVAVGTVVMNRVNSTRFPNTVEEVIAQPYQFTPYEMGLYTIALAKTDLKQSCIDAAKEVLEKDVRNGDWLFFRRNNDIVKGTVIGNHVFY